MPKLQITSTTDGFRRGGRAWSREPTVVDADELTVEQLEQIRGESRLTVVELDAGEKKPTAKGGKAAKADG